jgi:hypothetical protein
MLDIRGIIKLSALLNLAHSPFNILVTDSESSEAYLKLFNRSKKKEFKLNTISLPKFINIELSIEELLIYEILAGKTFKNSYKNNTDTVKAKGIFLVY